MPKKNLHSFYTTLSVMMLLSVLSGCGRNPIPANTEHKQPAIFSTTANTVFPDSNTTLISTEVYTNYVKLNYSGQPPVFSVGNVLVGTRDGGYLRRVVAVHTDGNSVTLGTVPAKIWEAFDTIRVDTVVQAQTATFTGLNKSAAASMLLKACDTTYPMVSRGKNYLVHVKYDTPRLAGSGLRKAVTDEAPLVFGWTFPNLEISIEAEDDGFNEAVTVTATYVTYGFTLKLDCALESEWLTVKRFRLALAKTEWKEFKDLQVEFSSSIISEEFEKPLIPDIPVLATFPVGPVVFTAGFSLKGGISAELATGAQATVTLQELDTSETLFGAEWLNGNWQAIDEKNITYHNADISDAGLSASITANAMLYIKPAIDLSLYSVIGPAFFAKLGPYIELTFPPVPPTYEFGVELDVGAELSCRIFDLPDFTITPLSWRIPFKQGTLTAPSGTIFQAPSSITLRPCNGAVIVRWTPVDSADAYKIYWTPFATLDTATANRTIITSQSARDSNMSYTVSDLTNGTLFIFAVSAMRGPGESALSDVDTARPYRLNPPSGLTATPANGCVVLKWSPVSNATNYRIYHSAGTSVDTSGSSIPGISNTAFTVNGLTNGTPYAFAVSAADGYSVSDLSQVVVCTPQDTIPYDTSLIGQPFGTYWNQILSHADFNPRNSPAACVFDNKMWIMGGWCWVDSNRGNDRNVNDVWFSTDGQSWSCATSNAAFPAREEAQALSFNNKMWIIGGCDWAGKNDVWSSVDGIAWSQATSNAGFSPRQTKSAVFNNKMWVVAGREWDWSATLKDIWYSSDGVSWTQATSDAGFSYRSDFGLVVFNNKMWVIGGWDGSLDKNDVWSSSDGITWQLATNSATFSPRKTMTVATINNQIFLIGGESGGSVRNDVWSSYDGINWTLVNNAGAFPGRCKAALLNYQHGLWLMTGYGGAYNELNDVWYATQ